MAPFFFDYTTQKLKTNIYLNLQQSKRTIMIAKLPYYSKHLLSSLGLLLISFGLNAQLISILNVSPPASPTSCTNTAFDVLV